MSGHFSAQDYAELDTELDTFVAPIDNEYFGSPGDLDGNDRVIVFFTGQVNRLSSQNSSSIVIGFFTSLDLLDPSDCPSSNEAEVVWLIGPDPDGTIGATISAQFVKSIARGLVAHEYQHLLNAEQRFVLGNGLFNEDIWMNEGLSHIAEEAAGLFRILCFATNRDLNRQFHAGLAVVFARVDRAQVEATRQPLGHPEFDGDGPRAVGSQLAHALRGKAYGGGFDHGSRPHQRRDHEFDRADPLMAQVVQLEIAVAGSRITAPIRAVPQLQDSQADVLLAVGNHQSLTKRSLRDADNGNQQHQPSETKHPGETHSHYSLPTSFM